MSSRKSRGRKLTPIDWDEVRTRLESARVALDRALAPDRERVESAWRARAAALGRQRQDSARESGQPILRFAVGGETMALPLTDLAAVLPGSPGAPVPRAPAAVLGLLGLRGGVVPVLDLRVLLGLPPEESGGPGFLVLLRQRELALRVDVLEGVGSLSPGEALAEGPGPFLRGRMPDGTALLDAGKLLEHPLLHPDIPEGE